MTDLMTPEDAYYAILAARDDAEGELTEAGVAKALAPLFAEVERLRDECARTIASSINADWIAMTLADDAHIEDGRLTNGPYLAVKIATQADGQVARLMTMLDAERRSSVEKSAMLEEWIPAAKAIEAERDRLRALLTVDDAMVKRKQAEIERLRRAMTVDAEMVNRAFRAYMNMDRPACLQTLLRATLEAALEGGQADG